MQYTWNSPLYISGGGSGYIFFKEYCILLSFTNSVDQDEMQHCTKMLHFIWVFTVCKSALRHFLEYKELNISESVSGHDEMCKT